MSKNAKFFVGGAILAIAAGQASAATVVADIATLSPKAPLNYLLDANGTGNFVEIVTLAGIFNWDRTGGTAGPGIGAQFQTVCIELTQGVLPNQSYTFDVGTLEEAPQPGSLPSGSPLGMGPAKAQLVRKLWAEYFDDALLSGNNAAAFQTAVWEIVYDDGLDLASGEFQAKTNGMGVYINPHVNTSVAWLNNLANLTAEAPLISLISDTEQDQVLVPEPTFGAVAALGLLAAGRRRRA